MEERFNADETAHASDLDAQHVPLLAILHADELHALRRVATAVDMAADVSVIHEGQQPHALYLVRAGLLMVNKRHGDTVYRVGAITPGEVFGEASILYDAPAGAGVRTLEPTQLYEIGIPNLRALIDANAQLKRALTQLAERRSAATALAVNPIFSRLPQAVREVAVYNGQFVSIAAGETVLREGDRDTRTLYVVLGGTAEASIRHPRDAHKRIVFARMGGGDELGEIAAVTGGPHMATVTATSALRLMAMRTDAVQAWRQRYPDFALALKTCVQRKLQHGLEAMRQVMDEDEARALTTGMLPAGGDAARDPG
jgi:CRP-like cAMP-binding protein